MRNASGSDKKSSVADSDTIGSTTFDRIRIHYFKGGSEDPDPLFRKGGSEFPNYSQMHLPGSVSTSK